MKEFNIQRAREGYPVCTRDGRAARVICWDCKNHMGEDDTPIVALVQLSDGGEYPYCYYENGLFTDRHTDKRDLMLATTKHEGWVNVYKNNSLDIYETDGLVYETKEIALKEKHDYDIATIKIEWEEQL